MNARIRLNQPWLPRLGLLAATMTAVAAFGFAPPATDKPAAKADDKAPAKAAVPSDPYPLGTCVVSGEKLGSMGKPIVKEYDGREVRLCCSGCIKQFEADKAGFMKKIDDQIIAQQLPHYPLKNCVVMPDDSLSEEGAEKPVNLVYQNRLVRFCCEGCVKDFKKDPAPFLKKLDEAVIKEQKPNYPLDTDVVTGEKLGPAAIDHVFGVMLVRFASADSIAKFKADPLGPTTKLHEAWAAKHPAGHGDAKPAPKTGAHG
jgi:hypothetical protein